MAVLGRSALPYGYSLTVWTVGAVLEHDVGKPSIGDVWLFLGGALLGFTMLGALAFTLRPPSARPSSHQLLRTGSLQFLAVGGALGAACLIGLLPARVAWPLSGFTATAVYLLAAAIELVGVPGQDDDEAPAGRGELGRHLTPAE